MKLATGQSTNNVTFFRGLTVWFMVPIAITAVCVYLYEFNRQHRWQHYDAPGKTEVLILGDSISIGYTPRVIDRLGARANVNRPLVRGFSYLPDPTLLLDFGQPVNCRGTTYTLENLDTWLGAGEWDVIHANWGQWDTRKVSVPRYTAQLDRIVAVLKRHTRALVIATTTPVTERAENPAWALENAKIAEMNNAIRSLSRAYGFYVSDLYALVHGREDLYSRDGRHLTDAGYTLLGTRVASAIEPFL